VLLIAISMVALSLSLQTSVSNAQEIIDIPTEETIVEVPVEVIPLPESSLENVVQTDTVVETPVELITPPVVSLPEEPIVVIDARDDLRLELISLQALSFESTGEYTQIAENKQIVDGDVITFEASAPRILKGNEEVHVYEAPCGRGWQVIIRDESIYEAYTDIDQKIKYRPTIRSYGYGCEHTERTFNW